MEKERKINSDIPSRIAELQSIMKESVLKYKLYRILLRGKGLEFESYRDYTQNDDASSIDWKASMRANKILVKQYKEEKNLKIMFLVDVSDNMVFGSTEKLKCEYASEIMAAFSHLIITTGDKVGSIFFSDKIKSHSKPEGGDRSFHKIVNEITNASLYGGAQNLDMVFKYVLDYLGREIDSLVIISDFISFSKDTKKKLEFIAQKFETVLLSVRDPLDNTLPDFKGEINIQDPRTGQQMLLDPRIAKGFYERYAFEQQEMIRKLCRDNGVDFLEIRTSEPFVPALAEFLKGRVKQTGARHYGRSQLY